MICLPGPRFGGGLFAGGRFETGREKALPPKRGSDQILFFWTFHIDKVKKRVYYN